MAARCSSSPGHWHSFAERALRDVRARTERFRGSRVSSFMSLARERSSDGVFMHMDFAAGEIFAISHERGEVRRFRTLFELLSSARKH